MPATGTMARAGLYKSDVQKARDALVAAIPVNRIGVPEDIWLAVRFIIECEYFNGRTIDVDNWEPKVITEGPSLWGHDRSWLTPEGREPETAAYLDALRTQMQVAQSILHGLGLSGEHFKLMHVNPKAPQALADRPRMPAAGRGRANGKPFPPSAAPLCGRNSNRCANRCATAKNIWTR